MSSKDPLPVDDGTPDIRTLKFRRIEAANCHVAGAYLYGLPEKKIQQVEMEDVRISYAREVKADIPAMLEGVEPVSKMGVFAANIDTLVLKNVTVEGQRGEKIVTQHIEHLIEKC